MMHTVRALAPRTALLWIVWQCGLLAAAPVVFAHSGAAEQHCQCPLEQEGQQCPMRHHSQSAEQQADGKVRCAMRSASDSLGFGSFAFATIGFTPSSTQSVAHPPARTSRVNVPQTIAVSRAHQPDAPPPRD